MTTEKNASKLVTPEILCSYPHLFEAVDPFELGTKKYSLQIMIPKTEKAFLAKMKAAILAADEAKWGAKAADIVKNLKVKHPVRDGDDSDVENEYAKGCFFLSAKSKSRPGVVDKSMQQIIDPDDIYPGCIIRAAINFYGFEVKSKKGIAVGLNNVMKVKDGEQIGGKASAEDDFSEFKSESEETSEEGDVF